MLSTAMESVKNQQTKNIYYWPLERDELLNSINGDRLILNDLLNILTEVNNNTTCKEERSDLNLASGKKSILKTQKQEESKLLRGTSSKKVSFKLPEDKIANRTQKPSRIPIFIGSKPADNVKKIRSTKNFNFTYPYVVKSTNSMSYSDKKSYAQENQLKADQIASSSYFKVNDTTYKEIKERTYLNTTAEKKSILKKQIQEEYKHLPLITKASAKRVSFKLPENEIPSRTQKPSRIPILIRSKLGRNHIREPTYTKISTAKAPRSSCLSQSCATDGVLKPISADSIYNTKSRNSTNYPTTSTASSVKCAVESHQKNSSPKASKIEFKIYRAVFCSSGFYLEQIF